MGQTEVVAAPDAGALVSCRSALEAHGVAHDAGLVCRFHSDVARAGRGGVVQRCTPLRSSPSRLRRAEPHRGQAAGLQESKDAALPVLDSGGRLSRRSLSRTAPVGSKATGEAPPHVIRKLPIAPVGRGARGFPDLEDAAAHRGGLWWIAVRPYL